MSPLPYTEDILVQQTTAEYLEQALGWEAIYAYNNEDFGVGGYLGVPRTWRWCRVAFALDCLDSVTSSPDDPLTLDSSNQFNEHLPTMAKLKNSKDLILLLLHVTRRGRPGSSMSLFPGKPA